MSCYIASVLKNPDGVYTITHVDGKTQSEIHIENNLLQGKKYEYDYKGTLVSEITYKDGMRHGIEKSYYPNGKKFVVKHYKKDRLCGYYKKYSETGKEICKILYSNNKIIREY